MAFGISGLVLALLLWNVGLVAVLPTELTGALFGLAALAGLRALWPLRLAPKPERRLGTLAGLLTVGSVVAYLAVFFHAGAEVAVERRVGAPATGVERLRLVDFNVLHGYPEFVDQEKRYGRLLSAFKAMEPTVIVLQESWSVVGHGHLAERLGADLGLDVAYARANGSRRLLGFEEGSAVLSRLPITEARRIVLSPRRPVWETRIALLVRVQVGPSETVPVVGTHLTHRDHEVAGAQARDLARRVAPAELFVLAGDFNSGSGSPAVSAFEDRGLVDLVPGGIDHVLARPSGSWHVENAGWTLRPRELGELIGETVELSDHPGIVVDFVRAAGS